MVVVEKKTPSDEKTESHPSLSKCNRYLGQMENEIANFKKKKKKKKG